MSVLTRVTGVHGKVFGDIIWNLALLFGWLSPLPTALAWHAERKFKTFLRAPFSAETVKMARFWQYHSESWRALGVALSGFSISCLVVWAAIHLL